MCIQDPTYNVHKPREAKRRQRQRTWVWEAIKKTLENRRQASWRISLRRRLRTSNSKNSLGKQYGMMLENRRPASRRRHYTYLAQANLRIRPVTKTGSRRQASRILRKANYVNSNLRTLWEATVINLRQTQGNDQKTPLYWRWASRCWKTKPNVATLFVATLPDLTKPNLNLMPLYKFACPT
jgi:hypothetical protein